MQTKIIDRTGLDTGAILPECLDIQYVSDDVFAYMQRNRVGFHDPAVAERRRGEALNEYRRSLVYGKQVVIQRAYLFTPMVYQDFEEKPGNEYNRAAFRALVEEAAILPYLFDERDLSDAIHLARSDTARAAFSSLSDLFQQVTCVRMHTNDSANSAEIGRMAQAFQAYCLSVRGLRQHSELLNGLAAEVLRQPGSGEELAAFGDALDQISQTAWDVAGKEVVTRRHLYERLLNEPGTHPDEGIFKQDSSRAFVLAKKRVIDLRYNTNLPDFLRRYSFTPTGLPTRAALASGPSMEAMRDSESLLDDLRTQIRQTVMSRMHEACVLPPLHVLSLSDVFAVRRLPEWKMLMDAQAKILADPVRCLHLLESFADAFSAFQRSFSRWYYQTYERAERVAKYGSVVRVAVKVLNRIAIAQVPGVDEKLYLAIASDYIPDKAYEFTARLFVDVVDLATGIPDPHRSYSMDLMTAGLELTREDIRGVIEAFGGMANVQSMEGANAGSGS